MTVTHELRVSLTGAGEEAVVLPLAEDDPIAPDLRFEELVAIINRGREHEAGRSLLPPGLGSVLISPHDVGKVDLFSDSGLILEHVFDPVVD